MFQMVSFITLHIWIIHGALKHMIYFECLFTPGAYYIYSRVYVNHFCQIFQGTRLFKVGRLFRRLE